MQVYKFIIDVETHDKNNLLRRLNKLKNTLAANGGEYWQDPNYSQVLVETTKTEEELDQWLYENNFDYVGVVPQK